VINVARNTNLAATRCRLMSGEDCLERIGMLTRGRRWALVTSEQGLLRWKINIATSMRPAMPDRTVITDQPNYQNVDEPVQVIVGFGGGGSIDAAKAFLWKQNCASKRTRNTRLIAIPTLSGSGSEVTPFASLWSNGIKSSIEDNSLRPAEALMVPDWALGIDPIHALPPALDALAHALDAIWNVSANACSDRHAFEAARALPALIDILASRRLNGAEQARLMQASAHAGLAIALTHTALAHSLSYPLTGELGLTHGLASSVALPEIAELNMGHAPDRLQVAASAFRCSLHELPTVLRRIVRQPGILSRFNFPDPDVLDHLRTNLTASDRAANNIYPSSEQEARSLARRAFTEIRNV